MTKVAIVTGSNKGIGLSIVRGLCKEFKGDVYLTSRDVTRGQEAVDILKKEGLNPKYHQLDVLDKDSIGALRNFMEKEYGGVDILVNNAGILSKKDDPTSLAEQADVTIKTNYLALLAVSDAIFPILKPGARVVHVSSSVTMMFFKKCSEERKTTIIETSTVDQVTSLMNQFVQNTRDGNTKENGWSEWAYGASKLAVSAVTPIHQANIEKDKPGQDIIVNCCCPGMVSTDLVKHKGGITPDEGAKTPIYAALLPPNEPTIRGVFLYKLNVYDWKAGECPSFK